MFRQTRVTGGRLEKTNGALERKREEEIDAVDVLYREKDIETETVCVGERE